MLFHKVHPCFYTSSAEPGSQPDRTRLRLASKHSSDPCGSIKPLNNDIDEPSTCSVCKRTAQPFKLDGFSKHRVHCSLTLSKATEFQQRISCATCQSIWHMPKDRNCPKGENDSNVKAKATAFCKLCVFVSHIVKQSRKAMGTA